MKGCRFCASTEENKHELEMLGNRPYLLNRLLTTNDSRVVGSEEKFIVYNFFISCNLYFFIVKHRDDSEITPTSLSHGKQAERGSTAAQGGKVSA